MIKVVVSGAGGRVGKLLIRAVIEEEDVELIGALEKPGSAFIGKDAGDVAGCSGCGVTITDEPGNVLDKDTVVIEFSTPEAALSHLPAAAKQGCGVVIGTTGFSEDDEKKIEQFSKRIPVLLSPNMSVGVNVMFKAVGEIAKWLGNDFDVEIVETHHRMKKDAPSGTALKLGGIIARATGRSSQDFVYGRKGETGMRKRTAIGIHAVRGGTVAGEHMVVFAGDSERVELTHRAESRNVFVRGVVKAIRYIAEAPPGMFDMQDVLSGLQTWRR